MFKRKVLVLTQDQYDALYIAIRRTLDMNDGNHTYKWLNDNLHAVKHKIDGRP